MEKLDLRYSISQSLTFCTFSSEEIKRLKVVNIITPLSFNAIGHPLPGGLYDPALGPIDSNSSCSTCKMKIYECPGHFGCIELPLPVANPLYHKVIANIFQISCMHCHTILIPTIAKYVLSNQIKLLDKGFFIEASELGNRHNNIKSTFWESLKQNKYDIGTDLLLIANLEQYVKDVLKNEALTHLEVKGESDLRKSFIDNALSYRFKGKLCPFCNHLLTKIQVIRNKIVVTEASVKVAKKFKSKSSEYEHVNNGCMKSLTPKECYDNLEKIWQNDNEILKAILPMLGDTSDTNPIESLFMNFILVTPTNTRPCSFQDGLVVEHPQNSVYKSILSDCLILRSIILLMNNEECKEELLPERKEVVEKLRGSDYSEKLQFAWFGLQENVGTLLDIESKKTRYGSSITGIGLKQIIEKKHGILRMNMMGKRVNFAARTVITPDPNLNIDEIGIPEVFAKKLTYPVVVTAWNVEELRKLVINGPDVHPGANFIVDEAKKIQKIDANDAVKRESIAKRLLTPGDKPGFKVVHRHLVNGDVLLLNRQPTLHRPSIMAHKARILKGEKTFRLHYANCKSYNADFDGDEMNAHFPQNEVARSEGYNLVGVSKQYLVPKDGTPLSGLIQDHMVSGVRLSMRGKMFSKSQYMQLVFQALSHFLGDIKILKPCILKPLELWSGKQVISTVLLNLIPKDKVPINLTSKAKISSKAWQKGQSRPWIAGGTPFKDNEVMTEAEVIIRGGELLSGVLDKTHYGATPYSLVHCIYELYGGEVSSAFLSSLAKLFTAFLQMEGFTLGVEDILVLKNADIKRTKIIKKSRSIGDDIVSDLIEIPFGSSLKTELAQMYAKDRMFRDVLDHKYKSSLDEYTNDINKTCIPKGLLSPFPNNNLQLMVQSGAKGSTVNTMQISCLLGQIELEGKRPPLMVSGKSLPSFPCYDTSPRAGGFVDGRFMTGIKPQEFFFHCMAGREGLIDTAVKTSRSGYLQRCLVKHLEGLNVNYDMTVRDSDGSVIQFLYGEDGLEVMKCQFLKENQMPFLMDNMYAIHNKDMVDFIKEHSDLEGIKAYNKIIKRWKKDRPSLVKHRTSAFCKFSEHMKSFVDVKNNVVRETGRSASSLELCKQWRKLSEEEKTKYENMSLNSPDTLVSRFQPDRNYGALTEKMDQLINDYFEKQSGEIKEKTIRKLINEKVLTAICPPGEPVGLLAAQSVGEPSTQMTLNTFHFAGRGEMNVTLGIPRLREILMIASKNIKTPSMVFHFKDIPKLDYQVNKLRKKMTRISLADVLQTIHIHESIEVNTRRKVYTLKMQFLPHEAYIDNTSVTPKQILKFVEKKFMKGLFNKLKLKSKKKKELIIIEEESNERHKESNSDDDGEEKVDKKIAKAGKKGGIPEDYQSSEDEPEGDDDDATTAKLRGKHLEEHQYSDLEDDASVKEEVGGEDDDNWNQAEEVKQEESTVIEEEEEERKANVISDNCIIDYKYDTVKEEWCEIKFGLCNFENHINISTIFKGLCCSCIIHEVTGIKKAFIQTDKTGRPILRTDGLNFTDIFSYDKLIDYNKLYSNDIHAMANIYGIEAASSIIVKEVQDVFKGYGITVDTRHLNLIASYMTFSGVYVPLSRKGMEGGASPLQQMSFESSLGFLKSAVIRHKKDDLCSPSSRLMMGAPVKSGTGSFKLLHALKID